MGFLRKSRLVTVGVPLIVLAGVILPWHERRVERVYVPPPRDRDARVATPVAAWTESGPCGETPPPPARPESWDEFPGADGSFSFDGSDPAVLYEAAYAGDAATAHAAQEALAEFARVCPDRAAEVQRFLITLAKTASREGTRARAASLVDFDRIRPAGLGAFLDLLGDPSPPVRHGAVDALGGAKERRNSALSALKDAYRAETSRNVRVHAIDAIVRIGDAGTLSDILGVEPKLESYVRGAAGLFSEEERP